MRFNISEKHLTFITYLLFAMVLVFTLTKPIQPHNDSEGYLTMSIIRSAPYPILLAALKHLFGSFFNFATIFFQVCLGIFAVGFLMNTIKKHITLHNFWYLFLTLILLLPYVYHHAIANGFLSEALAYPLYLIAVAQYITLLNTQQNKNFIYLFTTLFILILTRKQFLFLVPIGILILMYVSFKTKNYKKHIWVFAVFLCVPFFVSIADKTYHKIKHNHFVSTPWSGIHFITPAFYVADEEDISLYNTPEERLLFSETYKQLALKQLNIHNLDSLDRSDNIMPYITHYSEIANHTVLPAGIHATATNNTEDEVYIAVDILTLKMTLPLIRDNFKAWLNLYIKNIIHAFGNAKYLLIYLILLVYALVSLIRKKTKQSEIISLVLLLTFSNIILVAIGMHTLKRFTFYNDWTLFLVLFILLETFNSRNPQSHE